MCCYKMLLALHSLPLQLQSVSWFYSENQFQKKTLLISWKFISPPFWQHLSIEKALDGTFVKLSLWNGPGVYTKGKRLSKKICIPIFYSLCPETQRKFCCHITSLTSIFELKEFTKTNSEKIIKFYNKYYETSYTCFYYFLLNILYYSNILFKCIWQER